MDSGRYSIHDATQRPCQPRRARQGRRSSAVISTRQNGRIARRQDRTAEPATARHPTRSRAPTGGRGLSRSGAGTGSPRRPRSAASGETTSIDAMARTSSTRPTQRPRFVFTGKLMVSSRTRSIRSPAHGLASWSGCGCPTPCCGWIPPPPAWAGWPTELGRLAHRRAHRHPPTPLSARRASSATNRALPMPASPVMSTTRPRPYRATVQAAVSAASSDARPKHRCRAPAGALPAAAGRRRWASSTRGAGPGRRPARRAATR
jgi:hypothetical protein